ncbi:MAG: DUF1893 domain-containing protein [Candidatus Bathyarchaeia archaeon]
MLDLTLAKLRLKEKNLTLSIVKGGKVLFETRSHGIVGLLQAIEELGQELIESSVADKIVGRAAALLCAYSGVASVFAVTISEEGRRALEDNHIFYRFENRVPNILNDKRTDLCPFEKLTSGLTNPKEAYEKIKFFVNSVVRGSEN